MEKVSKLLQETQQLLEDFSSGTLSPVSSYFDSEREEEGEGEEGEESDCYFGFDNFKDTNENYTKKEFRELLRSKDFPKCIKLIESWEIDSKFPKMALHVAVEENCKDSEIFKALLRIGCDPLTENSEHKTALTLLLEQKETVAIVSEENCLISSLLGEWELRKASMAGSKLFKLIHERDWKSIYTFLQEQTQIDPVKLLCKADAKFAGLSPLHEIAAINDVDTFKKLLNKFKSIDLNVKSIGTGNTPLHEATHMSATEMVLFLLESGARCDIKNAAGKVPAHLGTEKVQVLIEFKTSSRKSLPNSISSNTVTSKNNTHNSKDKDKDSKENDVHLHVHVHKIANESIRKSHSSTLSSKKTADLFVQSTKSVSNSNESLSREERKLKQIIGFLDQTEKHKDHQHEQVVKEDDLPKINSESKLILQRESATGRTILHRYARRNQHEKLMKFLKANPKVSGSKRKLKAIFGVVDNNGNTPLHEAAAEGSFEVAKILLFGPFNDKYKDKDTNINSTNNNNKLSNYRMKILLIDPSIVTSITGNTPLHEASYAGHFKIVQLLLSVGGDKRIKNLKGKIPVDLTKSKKIRKLLLSEEEDEEEESEDEDEDVDSEDSETETEDDEDDKKKKKKAVKKEKFEMNTSKSTEKLIKSKNLVTVSVPTKRGPGRPRKYPRVDEEEQEQEESNTGGSVEVEVKVKVNRPVPVIVQESNYSLPEPEPESLLESESESESKPVILLTKEPLPLKTIFESDDESISILVVKLKEQIGWCLVVDQFLKICEYLEQLRIRRSRRMKDDSSSYHQSEATSDINEQDNDNDNVDNSFYAKYSRHYHQISLSDRQQILQLPPLGRLVETLNSHSNNDYNNNNNGNSSLLTLIPKALAVKLLEEEFNYSLTGPFGYIDVKKIITRRELAGEIGTDVHVKAYSGCPLKLKMKLDRLNDSNRITSNSNSNSYSTSNIHNHNHNSQATTSTSTSTSTPTAQFSLTNENPKSPKTFQF